MNVRVVAACLVLPLTALAHSGDHEDGVTHDPDTGEHVQRAVEDAGGDGPFSKGRWVFRGGANVDLNQSINLGGQNPNGAAVVGGLNAGVGYFIIENLSLDLDASSHFQLTPEPGVLDLGLTPGARYQIFSNAYVRAGMPLLFIPAFGLGVLGGAGYYQPIAGSAALVVGVDYTYYLTENFRQTAPLGRVDLHAGVQTWF